MSPMNRSQNEFAAQGKDVLASTRLFKMKYGEGPQDFLDWEILEDTEHEDLCSDWSPPSEEQVVNELFDAKATLEDNFFKHAFPSIEGHGKIIDKFLANPLATYYTTVRGHKIRFHDPDNPANPDWKVRQGYLIIIAAASEMENGIDNLWKSGMKNMRRPYPNFGRFMSVNEFRAFCSAAPYAWAEEKYWHLPTRDTPWEVFLPCLANFNRRRQELIGTKLLLLDESMSGWRPKTSKLGGLPNYTFEPRKPVPLGTMFRNSVECLSGVIVFQDVVQLSEVQSKKKYFNNESSLPNNSCITAHAAEVLRQVEGAQLPPGGWAGGDSWFGSVLSAVEVMTRFKVHSTWVIKQNSDFFPMAAIHSVLTARCGDKPAGHWVVFKTTINGIKLAAIGYAWSHSSVSYFVTTCGSTHPAVNSYETHFEDEFGVVQTRKIRRPRILEWVYDYLPLLDEHNKQRQSLLRLEKKWPTKNCWFRLITTLVGMSIVDLHCVYLNHDKAKYAKVDVIEFSDLICSNLRSRSPGKAPTLRNEAAINTDLVQLRRITNRDGEIARTPTNKQRGKQGREVGNAFTANCFICRKYLLVEGGKTNYVTTAFCCALCMMPLCKVDRRLSGKRKQSCLQEHLTSIDPVTGCFDMDNRRKSFPKSKQVHIGSAQLEQQDDEQRKRSSPMMNKRKSIRQVTKCICCDDFDLCA